jgi:hypothetical protein
MDALAANGETAPLLLMRSALLHALGEQTYAQADAERVIARWGETDVGAVARSWVYEQDADVPAIPFPSAIAPRLSFCATAEVGERVQG